MTENNIQEAVKPEENIASSQRKKILVRSITCLVILLFGTIISVFLFSLSPEPKKKSQSELVKVLQATPIKVGKTQLQIIGYGTAQPLCEVMLSAEIKGRIVMKSNDLKPGMLVKKGQILAKIDVSDYKIAMNEALADIEVLKAEQNQMRQFIKDTEEQLKREAEITQLLESNFHRQSSLAKKGISAKKSLEDAERNLVNQKRVVISTRTALKQKIIQLTSVKARLKRAEAQKNKARINIERSVIRSPFQGRLKNLLIDNGEYVQPGTQLFNVADDTQLEIPIFLDAYDVAKLLGITINHDRNYLNWFTKIKNSSVKINWAEDPGLCCWEGKIIRIEYFDPETRTIKFIIRPERFVSGRKGYFPIVSGMFCKVFLKGIMLEKSVKIPWVAIQLDGDAYVVGRDGRLQQRKINIFSIEGDNAVVSSGLRDGELLIIQRLPRGLINGMKIKPINPVDGSYYNNGEKEIKKKAENEKKPVSAKKNRKKHGAHNENVKNGIRIA